MKKLLLIVLIVAVLWFYTFLKISQFEFYPLMAAIISLAIIGLMIGWLVFNYKKSHLIDRLWFQALAWFSTLMMGVWATFILLSLPIDIFLWVYQRVASPLTSAMLLKFNYSILMLTSLISLAGLLQILAKPKVKEIKIPIKGIPAALNNLTILQISDLHIGPTIQRRYVEDVVNKANATKADLIVLTGDLADAKPYEVESYLEPLRKLKAPFGLFYVTGNHEYYWGGAEWVTKVKELGFSALINENVILKKDNATILLAGITDHEGEHFVKGHKPDLNKAIRTKELTDLKILLAHRPDVCFEAERLGFDLQLSGHTHAGQFFPFRILVSWVYKYYRNLHKEGNLWVYVNAGTGYWGPANRFGIPAEISLIRLVVE